MTKNLIEKCPICSSDLLQISSLGNSVISGYVCATIEESAAQPIFKLGLCLCKKCGALFQSKQVDAENILEKIYTEHEATIRNSDQYIDYYDEFSDNVVKKINEHYHDSSVNVLEIGCNDGLLLSLIGNKTKAMLYGVEPSTKFAAKWVENGIIGVNKFFGSRIAEKMKQEFGEMDIILIRHVLEHIPDPHDFFSGLKIISEKNVSIYIEVPYVNSIFNLKRFENVSYTHLIHYGIKSMVTLAAKHQFKVTDYWLCDIDGGSIVFILQPSEKEIYGDASFNDVENDLELKFHEFVKSFEKSKTDLQLFINNNDNKKIIGFGAGAKGQYLIHIYGLQNSLAAVIDETLGYEGKYIPGTTIKIVGIDYLNELSSAVVINLAPTHKDAVRKKINDRFIFIDPVNQLF